MYIHCSVYFNSTHISIDINTHVFIHVYWYITFHSLKSDMHTCSQYSASLIVSYNLISPYFYLPITPLFSFIVTYLHIQQDTVGQAYLLQQCDTHVTHSPLPHSPLTHSKHTHSHTLNHSTLNHSLPHSLTDSLAMHATHSHLSHSLICTLFH